MLFFLTLWLPQPTHAQTPLQVATPPPPQVAHPDALPPFLLGGIQTHELDHERWASALHRNGMNAVQVTIYAHQGAWNTAKLWYADEEPAVLSEIRAARRNGLQVVLILRVALDHNEPENRHLWHGLVYPETELETREWFRLYGDFVVKWAKVAEREGIPVLGIASEMNALAATLPIEELPGLAQWYLDEESQQRLRDLVGRSEHLFTEDVRLSMGAGDFENLDDFLVERNRAERVWASSFTFVGAEDRVAAMNQRRRLLESLWRDVTRRVRTVYSGRLTLAANFDNYHEVGFWDVLDLMGVNAYFPLRDKLETPVSEEGLASSWREVLGDIERFKKDQDLDLPVVFTELGYTRWRGVTVAPWSSQGFIPMWDPDGETAKDRAFFWELQPLEPSERALALGALHRVWSAGSTDAGAIDLAGVLYWKLSSDRDLQRFEPFMLYLGEDREDPSLGQLRRFAPEIRPFGPLGKTSEARALDAIVRADRETFEKLLPGLPKAAVDRLLPSAVRLGRLAIVRSLLSRDASVEKAGADGFLPLHWACYQNDVQLVEELLPEGAGPWLDELGETPVMKCARLGNVDVARRLLRSGEEVDVQNLRRKSALHLAVDQAFDGRSTVMVELLLEHGATVESADEHGMSALHLAARLGEPELVRLLAKSGKGSANPEGNRPASEAAIHGRREAFELLYEPEAATERNVYGQSLLHLAAHGGDAQILRLLLPHFPEVDVLDDDGWTPLAFATRNGRLEAVELLLSKGASPTRVNQEGAAPLHLAASSREPWLIRQFLQQEDLAIDLADGAGHTALHHAAGWGRLENLRLLLAAGADAGLLSREGQTAIEVAEDSGRRRAVLVLRER